MQWGSKNISKRNKNLQLRRETSKIHYRMYKAGKFWLFAGLTTFTLAFGPGVVVHADTVNTTNAATTTQSTTTNSDSSSDGLATSDKASVSESAVTAALASTNSTAASTTNADTTSVSAESNNQSTVATENTNTSVTSTATTSEAAVSATSASSTTSTASVANSVATSNATATSNNANDQSTAATEGTNTNTTSVAATSEAATSATSASTDVNNNTNSATDATSAAGSTAISAESDAQNIATPESTNTAETSTATTTTASQATDTTAQQAADDTATTATPAASTASVINNAMVSDVATPTTTAKADNVTSASAIATAANSLATSAAVTTLVDPSSAELAAALSSAQAVYEQTGVVQTVIVAAAAATVNGVGPVSADPSSIIGIYLTTGITSQPTSSTVVVETSAAVNAHLEYGIVDNLGSLAVAGSTLGIIQFVPSYTLYSSTDGTNWKKVTTSSTGKFSVTPTTVGTVYYQVEATGTLKIAGGLFNVPLSNYYSDVVSVTAVAAPVPATSVSVTTDANYLIVGATVTTSKGSLTYNGTTQATATLTPSGSTSKVTSWTSSDNSVATVDPNGVVTAFGKGTAMITATVTNSDGSTVSGTSELITVGTGVDDETVHAGETATFTVNGIPASASGTTITYQWYKADGTKISGATGTSYTTAATTNANDGDQYYVVATISAKGQTETIPNCKNKLATR